VRIYERSAGAWPLRQTLTLPQAGVDGYQIGEQQLLALDGGILVCGAPNRSGINGPQIGRVTIINAVGSAWSVSDEIAPPQMM
jgi:hypothetical protein